VEGDPITHRRLLGIAVILFGISLTLVGGGIAGLLVSFAGLAIAALTPGTAPRR
jgi:hypothetical protein